VQAEPDLAWLARPDVHRGLSVLARHDLCFDVVCRPEHLPAATVAARAVPGLRLVLDHLGKPPVATGDHNPWRAALAPLTAVDTTTAKISGLVTEAARDSWRPSDLLPFVGTAFDLFGADRLMFGSDWPVCTLAADYAAVVDAYAWCLEHLGVSGADRAAVDRTTAITTYRLEDV
jgi:L-fuconolactonase